MALADYPTNRADHKLNGLGGPYAQRFTRLLIKQAAAQSISVEAFALLTVVVATEDAKRYRGPVAFYNEQLMMLLGFGSKERLVKARERAIEAGWLHYQAGAKSRAGLYFVDIPKGLAGIPDNPVDESEAVNTVLFPNGIPTGTAPEPLLEPLRNRSGTTAPYSTSTKTVTRERRSRAFAAPSLEEASEYWAAHSLKGNPVEFVDHYTANGWVQGRQGKPIRDWQAAARQWSRRQSQFGSNETPSSKPYIPLAKRQA